MNDSGLIPAPGAHPENDAGARILFRGKPVMTTEQLAKAYEVTPDNIYDGQRKNPDKFEEGYHFHKLTGAALKAFKDYPENGRVVAARAPSLILWTEAGALRHAKLLESPKAWEVFGKLEESYFAVKAGAAPALPASPAALARESASVFRDHFRIGRLLGWDRNMAALHANQAARRMVGHDVLAAMGAELVAEKQERLLRVGDLGAELGGLSPQAVNKLLTAEGFQTIHRDRDDVVWYEPTAKGRPFARLVDTSKRHADGAPVQHLKWTADILPRLRAEP